MLVVGRILAVVMLLIAPSARGDSLAFVSEPKVAGAGAITGPLQVIRTDAQGAPLSTGQPALTVRLVSDSVQGRFSLDPSPSRVWSSVLDVVIPAGSAMAPEVFYRDSRVGAPRIVASASGLSAGVQLQRITPFSFEADFESGGLFTTDGGVFHLAVGPVPLTLSKASAHRGTRGLSVQDTSVDAGETHARLIYLSGELSGSIHARAWMRATNVSSDAGVAVVGLGSGWPGQTIGDVILRFPGGHVGTQGHAASGVFTEVPGALALTPGTWHLVDLVVEGVGSTNASRRVWVDGQLSAQQTGVDLTGMFFGALSVGAVYVKDGTYNGDLDFDDVRVSLVSHATRLYIEARDAGFVANTCEPLTVRIEGPAAEPGALPWPASADLSLTGVDAGVFSDSSCLSATTSAGFDANTSSATVFISASEAGSLSVSASFADVLPTAATIPVSEGPVPGDRPVARVTVTPREVDPGEPVVLDASASTPGPHSTIAHYHWEILRGPTGVSLDASATQELVLPEPGRYAFRLTVEDTGGRTSDPADVALRVRGDPFTPPRALGCASAPGPLLVLLVAGLALRPTARRRRRPERKRTDSHAR